MVLTSLMMISIFIVFGTTQAHAVGEPSVSWTETDNQVVSGIASFDATSTPISPAKIVKWCLLFDGAPVTTNVSDYGPDGARSGQIIQYATFSGSTGCWTVSSSYSAYSLANARVSWDTTVWAPGPHTLKWTVTDSGGRTATLDVLNFTTNNPGPSVSWTETDNQVVSGIASFDATATPAASGTAKIVKWCLLFDGAPVTTNVSDYGPDGARSGQIIQYATFSGSTGCWTVSSSYSAYSLANARVSWDTTVWAPGPHTLKWTVTDSGGRTATLDVLNFTTNNPGPSVSWTETDNQVVSGIASFDATAAPAASGTAKIVKWCLLFDGAPATTDGSRKRPTFRSTVNAAFRESSTNCVEGTDIREMYVQWDTTTWVVGTHTLQWTVTDSSGRSTSSLPLTFTASNSQPFAYFGGLSAGQVVSGSVAVQLAAFHPGARAVATCFLIDNVPCQAGQPVTPAFSSQQSFIIDTTRMLNGNHTLTGLVVDDAGRWTGSTQIVFTTYNSRSTVTPSVAFDVAPPYPSKAMSVNIGGQFPNTQAIEVRIGTSSKKFGPPTTFAIVPNSPSRSWFFENSPGTFKIPNLKPSTTYYFEFLGKGINGDSVRVVVKAKSPAATPAPKPARSGSGGSYNGRTCANVREWRLDKAISKIRSSCGEPYYYNALACPTLFGIVKESNWYVYSQFGNQLGACQS